MIKRNKRNKRTKKEEGKKEGKKDKRGPSPIVLLNKKNKNKLENTGI